MIDRVCPNILITGAGGLVGRKVLERLKADRTAFGKIIALDVRETPQESQTGNVDYLVGDICDPQIGEILTTYKIDTVVHLAAILAPPKDMPPDLEYRVDVLGTENVVRACALNGVRQIIHLSSGAAYGYHHDNPVPLRETDALRGNELFPYSRHKRLAEEMLAQYRQSNPDLKQLIFRPGTILGANMTSPVSAIFEGRFVMGITGTDSPFVIILVDDVAEIIVKGIVDRREGIFNIAGDGTLSLRDIAERTGKTYLAIPAWVLKSILWTMKKIHLTTRGPEAVDFLRYRPVLANDRLKNEFGYTPTTTSLEAFDFYLRNQPNK